jgi:homoserine O-acetyltransferase
MKRLKMILIVLGFGLWAAAGAAQELRFATIGNLDLVSGEVLQDVRVGYITAGELNADKSNVLLFTNWFGGTAQNQIDSGLVGPGRLADTDLYFVIAVDALGNGVSTSPSNYGGPASAFPAIGIGDMVNSQYRLLTDFLDIPQVHAVMGFSMGGMQVFDWIGRYPNFMRHAISISGSPKLTSYGLLRWGIEKQIIETMRADGRGDNEIFSVLNSLEQLTLRTPDWMVENVASENLSTLLGASASSNRNSFDHESQIDAMMMLNVYGDTDGSRRDYLDSVKAKLLVIGFARDHLVHPAPAKQAATLLDGEYFGFGGNCGHLSLICDYDAIITRVRSFLNE